MIFPATIPVEAPRFTPARVAAYGALTNDMNPIHVDAAFAAASRFGRPIVHGLFVMAPVWVAIERAFGAAALAGLEADIRFVSPVFVGSTPRYSIEAITGSGSGRTTYALNIVTEAGTEAVTGTLSLPI